MNAVSDWILSAHCFQFHGKELQRAMIPLVGLSFLIVQSWFGVNRASRMSEQEIDRKITVIFATDVVGYSKHMEANESGTVINLRACEKILTGLFEKHKGRLFNTGGDSFLAEFPSAVSVIECAAEFQKAIKEETPKTRHR